MKRFVCGGLILLLILFSACGKAENQELETTTSEVAATTVIDSKIVKSAYTVYFSDLLASKGAEASDPIIAYETDLNDDGIVEVLYLNNGRPAVLTYIDAGVKIYSVDSEIFTSDSCDGFYFDAQKGIIVVRDDGKLKTNFNHHMAEIFQFGSNGLSSIDRLDGSTEGIYDLSSESAYEAAKKSSMDAFNKLYEERTKEYSLTDLNMVGKSIIEIYNIEIPTAGVATLE